MLRFIEESDLNISPITIPGCDAGYNIGDLLWAPILLGVDPSERRFSICENKRRLVAAHMPNSVVARYCRLHKSGDHCPNGDYLRQSVAAYGNTVNDPDILRAVSVVRKPTTLCVHMRSGDRGKAPMIKVFETLRGLVECFECVVVITGFHSRHRLYESEQQRKMFSDTRTYLNRLLSLSDKIRVQLKGSADDHLYLASHSSNLLLSSGGFSCFAGMCTKGQIFAPPTFRGKHKWVAELHESAVVEWLK